MDSRVGSFKSAPATLPPVPNLKARQCVCVCVSVCAGRSLFKLVRVRFARRLEKVEGRLACRLPTLGKLAARRSLAIALRKLLTQANEVSGERQQRRRVGNTTSAATNNTQRTAQESSGRTSQSRGRDDLRPKRDAVNNDDDYDDDDDDGKHNRRCRRVRLRGVLFPAAVVFWPAAAASALRLIVS